MIDSKTMEVYKYMNFPTDMLILLTNTSDTIVEISPSLGVTYHLDCDMSVHKYLIFATVLPEYKT